MSLFLELSKSIIRSDQEIDTAKQGLVSPLNKLRYDSGQALSFWTRRAEDVRGALEQLILGTSHAVPDTMEEFDPLLLPEQPGEKPVQPTENLKLLLGVSHVALEAVECPAPELPAEELELVS